MYAEAPARTRALLVGRNIAARRREIGMPQTRLALILDVSQQQVSRWERGVWEPKDASLARIADALGVEWTVFYLPDET